MLAATKAERRLGELSGDSRTMFTAFKPSLFFQSSTVLEMRFTPQDEDLMVLQENGCLYSVDMNDLRVAKYELGLGPIKFADFLFLKDEMLIITQGTSSNSIQISKLKRSKPNYEASESSILFDVLRSLIVYGHPPWAHVPDGFIGLQDQLNNLLEKNSL